MSWAEQSDSYDDDIMSVRNEANDKKTIDALLLGISDIGLKIDGNDDETVAHWMRENAEIAYYIQNFFSSKNTEWVRANVPGYDQKKKISISGILEFVAYFSDHFHVEVAQDKRPGVKFNHKLLVNISQAERAPQMIQNAFKKELTQSASEQTGLLCEEVKIAKPQGAPSQKKSDVKDRRFVPKDQIPCKHGASCKFFLQGKCKYNHDEEDFKLVDEARKMATMMLATEMVKKEMDSHAFKNPFN